MFALNLLSSTVNCSQAGQEPAGVEQTVGVELLLDLAREGVARPGRAPDITSFFELRAGGEHHCVAAAGGRERDQLRPHGNGVTMSGPRKPDRTYHHIAD